MTAVFVSVGVATPCARTITEFQAEGDCYTMASKYLKELGRPYLVSDKLKSSNCSWNFKGNTLADFETWCKKTGLKCGGNPYYVGYDSTWHNGEWMPAQRAKYLSEQEREQRALLARQDSINSYVPEPLPVRKVTIEYLELGKSTAERLGFDYSEYIGTASFSNGWQDLFSVTLQAKGQGDSTYIYRTYTTLYDSTLHVFWGGSRDKIKSSNVTSNGVVSNNYVTETYGLTFDIKDMHYSYTHSSDYEHSISGNGKLVPGRNEIVGVFQRTYTVEKGLPFLMHIPILGYLFKHVSDETETRYVFIWVTVGASDADGL